MLHLYDFFCFGKKSLFSSKYMLFRLTRRNLFFIFRNDLINGSEPFKLLIYWHKIIHIFLLLYVESIMMSLLSFLRLAIYTFREKIIFPRYSAYRFINFIAGSQRTSFWFHWFSLPFFFSISFISIPIFIISFSCLLILFAPFFWFLK